VPLDRVEKTVAIVERHIAVPVHQRFDVALDDAERGAQLMGDIGDKVLPDGLQFLLLGNIVKNKKYPEPALPSSGVTRVPVTSAQIDRSPSTNSSSCWGAAWPARTAST